MSDDPGRIVILSDLHLGRPHGAARSAAALRPLWAGAEHLVLNGDVAEIHHPGHRAVAARETMALLDLCDADGVELTMLSGNHDPYLTDRRHLALAGGLVFVTHGDVLHPAVSPWSPAGARMRAAQDEALAALEPEDRDALEGRLAASQHASFAEWKNLATVEEEAQHSTVLRMLVRPWALAQVLRYWQVLPGLADAFVAQHAPETRFIVLGHTHRAGTWRVGQRVVLNTGSFGFPGRPHAAVLENDTLTLVRIRLRRGRYALDPRPRRSFAVPAPEPERERATASPSA
jgi:predicted phosphodiesterase